MQWFGLGKRRSKLGRWLDQHGVAQLELEKESGLSRGTVSKLCSDEDYTPKITTAKKVINVLKKLDQSVDYKHFWDM